MAIENTRKTVSQKNHRQRTQDGHDPEPDQELAESEELGGTGKNHEEFENRALLQAGG